MIGASPEIFAFSAFRAAASACANVLRMSVLAAGTYGLVLSLMLRSCHDGIVGWVICELVRRKC